jgi:hypothetical protein
MHAYILWVSANPLLSAAIQFALLGSLGEFISFWIRMRKFASPCSLVEALCKIAAWALLGVIIKYGFTGMKGMAAALMSPDHHMLPAFEQGSLGWALTTSVLTNIFFGPQMMFFHRLEDNLIARKYNMAGIQRAWRTLIWFWIPAHTITFMLPKDLQIGVAAIWSVVLGMILGSAAPRQTN